MAQGLTMDALNNLAEHEPEELTRHLTALNVTKGVAVDKIIKFKQLGHQANDNRQLIIVIPGYQQPITIEAPNAEYQELGTWNEALGPDT